MTRTLMLGIAGLALASALAVGISSAVATPAAPAVAEPVLPAAMAMNMREVFPH